MKDAEFTSSLISPQYKFNTGWWFITGVLTIILIAASLTTYKPDQSTISETVNQLKNEIIMPSKIDEVTTLTDITAEPNAIRYHYILSGADYSNTTNEDFDNSITPSVCGNSDTRRMIDMGINLEYSYQDTDSGKTFFVSVTKQDCVEY